MKALNVRLENCYGIKSLDYDFSFETSNTFSIYAPNWIMKTSFAKTFHQLQKWEEPCDEMFKSRVTKCVIIDETKKPIDKDSIFVIQPYEKWYKASSESTSILLLRDKYRDDYEVEKQKIQESEDTFLQKVAWNMWLWKRQLAKEEILKVFDSNNLYDVILWLKANIDSWSSIYNEVLYNALFNAAAYKFLLVNQKLIKEYIESYNNLISSSEYLWSDFNHYRAKKLWDALSKMKFFKDGHKVSLFNSKTSSHDADIQDYQEYKTKIEEEEQNLYNNPDLKEKLGKIDKAIKNADLEHLRDYLFENQRLLTKLSNPDWFRKELLIDYFIFHKSEFDNLFDTIKTSKWNIDIILTKANEDKELWNKSIKEFNSRFINLPFCLDVQNIDEMITKNAKASILFKFKDIENNQETSTDEASLLKILSQGEKRALYLLNIIFEVQARKEKKQETLYIIDDIADSFDYKNKYAIIEYLRDIAQDDNCKIIFLTHNFDFFRTINGRLNIQKEDASKWLLSKRLFASREEKEITLNKFIYEDNPFKEWKNNLNEKNIIALIPFVRNLIEYWKGIKTDYNTLTHLLHKKNKINYDKKWYTLWTSIAFDALLWHFTIMPTTDIKFSDIKDIFNDYLWVVFPANIDGSKEIFPLIYDLCIWIINESTLENKIVLAIWIRLQAEEFIINKIKGLTNVDKIKQSQTSRLIKKIKRHINNWSISDVDENTIKILDSVNIMTPENIHLNSFMYEPILDMDIVELKRLYKKVKELNS